MRQNQKIKDGVLKGCIYTSAALTVFILVFIIGFIFVKGIPQINMHFLTSAYEDKTAYVIAETIPQDEQESGENLLSEIGVYYEMEEDGESMKVTDFASNTTAKEVINMSGESEKISKGDVISSVQSEDANHVRLKVTEVGGGIMPMLISTLLLVLLSLLVAAPIGILSAIYLNEYAKAGKILTLIRFAIQNLSGIPSIIYGLFGALVFVQMFKMQYSILAGALTVSIILLPTMISTTEESLKAIPNGIRESSLGLGATKLQTTMKVVVPNALPGILVAVILSIGRIVGESAALLLTAGTVAAVPTALTGEGAAAATLTIKAYTILKETGDVSASCGIGVVLIVLIIVLNIASKAVTARFMKKQQG
ncbi:MAG: phosphate ABC transporter permease PstA [Lachnospiraceae bacterium]|nr:phosphate ABC transporter permease PstA [Lachnospiraceae bacterium]